MFSEDLRIATKSRDEAYARAIHTGNELDWSQFKTLRNEVVKAIRKKKKLTTRT